MNNGLYSSISCEWETPQDFFDKLNAKWRFTLDVCATAENAKCDKFFTRDDDGLLQTWKGRCWMNPPYGREIGKWMKKAYESTKTEAECVVCLVPARTDTAWFHDYAMKGRIEFIRGRLRFGGGNNPAPFPSCVVTFEREDNSDRDDRG